MKCAILQPSYVPWRGYFDQIARSDVFVFYDDVQYDTHGWRNRNRIKTPNGVTWLTIPVAKKGHLDAKLLVKDAEIVSQRRWQRSHLETLRQSYAKAPHFDEYAPLVERHLTDPPHMLCDLTIPLTVNLARELGLQTRFLRSSELRPVGGRTERLVSILRELGADHYLSGPAARSYIERERFEQAGIELEFMQYDYPEYPQLYPPFEPEVSILDLLFMTGPGARDLIRATGGS